MPVPTYNATILLATHIHCTANLNTDILTPEQLIIGLDAAYFCHAET